MDFDYTVKPNLRNVEGTIPYSFSQSGLFVGQDSIYRYSHPSTPEPVLTIVDYIPDYNGNFIKPGHYILALSDDREFLLLIESHKLVAVIPVFKIAENKEELQKMYKRMAEEKEGKNKKKKFRETKHEQIKRLIDTSKDLRGEAPIEDFTYRNATIEYVKDGAYYLITYENGYIRAFGAIKCKE